MYVIGYFFEQVCCFSLSVEDEQARPESLKRNLLVHLDYCLIILFVHRQLCFWGYNQFQTLMKVLPYLSSHL